MQRRPVVLSLGGGLDSFALLVEAVRRGERIDVVVFVDVGHPDDPGEWPGTYRHVHDVVRPFCERHGIEFVVIDHANYPVRDARSLFAWLEARQQIPVAGPNRICTVIAKVERFEKWLDDRYPGQTVEVWVGFEAGEEARAATDPNAGNEFRAVPRRRLPKWWRWTMFVGVAATTARRANRFPLMEWGLCRCRCEALVRAAGHPVPRKSACVFCGYGTKGDWQRFAVQLPAMFARTVELEANKPPTEKNGLKLSIMNYRRGKPDLLPQFVAKPYRPKTHICKVCGGPRASKEAGCDYLDNNDAATAA